MKPCKLYKDVRIRGDDGFTMVKIVYYPSEDTFQSLMKQLKHELPDINSSSYYDWRYNRQYICNKFIKYLKDFCADGFCITSSDIRTTPDDDYRPKIAFYIGFRCKKDLFKFNMKFGSKRVLWWQSSMAFTVIGTIDDSYEKADAGEKWNKEDPNGMIRS